MYVLERRWAISWNVIWYAKSWCRTAGRYAVSCRVMLQLVHKSKSGRIITVITRTDHLHDAAWRGRSEVSINHFNWVVECDVMRCEYHAFPVFVLHEKVRNTINYPPI